MNSVVWSTKQHSPVIMDHHGSNNSSMYPYDVTVKRSDEDECFGFILVSSVTKGSSFISQITPNSPAERCSPRLHVGYRIFGVNHLDTSRLHHCEIVNLIRDSGLIVTLTVGPPIENKAISSRKIQSNLVRSNHIFKYLNRKNLSQNNK